MTVKEIQRRQVLTEMLSEADATIIAQHQEIERLKARVAELEQKQQGD